MSLRTGGRGFQGVLDFLREIQQIHYLTDPGARDSFPCRNSCLVQRAIPFHLLVPTLSQMVWVRTLSSYHTPLFL